MVNSYSEEEVVEVTRLYERIRYLSTICPFQDFRTAGPFEYETFLSCIQRFGEITSSKMQKELNINASRLEKSCKKAIKDLKSSSKK